MHALDEANGYDRQYIAENYPTDLTLMDSVRDFYDIEPRAWGLDVDACPGPRPNGVCEALE